MAGCVDCLKYGICTSWKPIPSNGLNYPLALVFMTIMDTILDKAVELFEKHAKRSSYVINT